MMLVGRPSVSSEWRARLEKLAEQTSANPTADLPDIIRDELKVDLSARYGGIEIAHPFGKASGQLSFTRQQVQTDLEAGIGFIVLKTAIAESPTRAGTTMATFTGTGDVTVPPVSSVCLPVRQGF